jgi:hypothetical protein
MFKCAGLSIKIYQGLNIYKSIRRTTEAKDFIEDLKKGQSEVNNVIRSEEFFQKLLKTKL